MVRLKDIAKACGVSAATVSRALNGLTDPAGKNTAYICQVAKEMGYYPNAAAKTLKTSRSNNIGILYEDRMDHEYFSSLLNELRFATEERGYDLTFFRRFAESDAGSYYERARRRNLDGALVIQADFNSADVMRLAAGSIPTVVIDHAYEGCDCVMCDNRESMEQIVQTVAAKGHQRIAFIRGEDSTVTRERTDGFYKGCAELGIRVPTEYMPQSHFHDPAACALAVEKLMACGEVPTCILCPDDFSCLGALSVLARKGLQVPRDISLIGYDGIRMTQMTHPRLTTYRQDTQAIAREAVKLLLDAVENPEGHQPRQITVSGAFIEGETLGPAKA